MQSLLSPTLQMILSLMFCDVISSTLFRSPTVAPLVARQPFLKIAYCTISYVRIKCYLLTYYSIFTSRVVTSDVISAKMSGYSKIKLGVQSLIFRDFKYKL